ncbi:tRNA preQ1(34) S-adenosylmethionine ribosyltransferase-isomerase QueA [Thermocrinis jamiesonii]|uniref:tRNA preQ1(34) S-adenosylmethionine ribosyltransferase-isomerase QueA n=1 Tax=Thermocrinis jamiesonii TaxID=1302351 RepID=UPI00049584ED|nr:tRNA preQ1(34) S-adenosylmethionine ribosyltransferase-isomerase QueA [Thermocrinis jamiesonii]
MCAEEQGLTLNEFDYHLPKELIAQYPTIPRHNARLMVLNRKDRSIRHDVFWNLPDYLKKGDLLVFNNSKVLPARLYGRKPTGGKVEILLTDYIEKHVWYALVGGKNIKSGLKIFIGEDLQVEILEHIEGGKFKVYLHSQDPLKALDKWGKIPIPPYLEREEEEIDRVYYQTVFAKEEGSVASPTASLHFSEELLEKLQNRGINIAFITLHVSYGTFKPVKTQRIEEHKVDPEYIKVPEETVKLIKETKERGNRVVAVGTTVVRALETKPFEPYEGWTELYIYPGYEFKVVDALITNFHLPKSSLLFLVCAFGGKDFIMEAYQIAVRERYRFYSYGDGMLIL